MLNGKPLIVELFAGMFGGSAGALDQGWRAIGFDLAHEDYHGPVPTGASLVIQDVLTLHGRQFKDADLIWASPPCVEYSYMAMPWSRGKQIRKALLGHGDFPKGYRGSRTVEELNRLFNACFRIQREACAATGRYIPMIVENVRGAIPWVGPAQANYGSFYLWGDVRMVGNRIYGIHSYENPLRAPSTRGSKQSGRNFHFPEKYGIPSPSFHGADHEPSVRNAVALKSRISCAPRRFDERVAATPEEAHAPHYRLPSGREATLTDLGDGAFRLQVTPEEAHALHYRMSDGVKIECYSDPRRNGGKGAHLTSQAENDRRMDEAIKQGGDWFNSDQAGSISRTTSSRSQARKAASAQIARIPYELSAYVARIYRPFARLHHAARRQGPHESPPLAQNTYCYRKLRGAE